MRDSDSAPARFPAPSSTVPLLSVIIPTYNLELYIMRCLDSITSQGFRDIEIVAVDGKSTDLTCELLEKRTTEEPRLRVMCNDRIGPGVARNIGARKATGSYIWFVDGDDELAEGCLASIAERLLTECPDVLLVNHAELSSGKALAAGQDDELLRREDGKSFLLAERPWLMDAGLVSWNKIARRAFFDSIHAEFARPWPHEDVPVSCELLLRAQRLNVLSDACYHYRRRRDGSVTGAGPRFRHFAVFDSWRGVLDRNRARMREGSCEPSVSPELYHRLFQRSIWHCTTILDTPGYVTKADRRAFFRQITRLYADYSPDDCRLPGGFRGVKFWLIAHKSYLGYSILGPPNKVRVAVRELLKSKAT
jgi:CDP-glycerol glycerophosphotransferase